jgi:hypothetical protein
LPLHPAASASITEYLETAGHANDDAGALFRPIHRNRSQSVSKAVTPDAIYKMVREYSSAFGFEIGVHALLRCARRPPPMHSITKPISPRSRNGSGMRTSRPLAFTIIVRLGQKTPTFNVVY